jgi:hypothetical protein
MLKGICIHICMHAYIHTYMHSFMHTCIYTPPLSLSFSPLLPLSLYLSLTEMSLCLGWSRDRTRSQGATSRHKKPSNPPCKGGSDAPSRFLCRFVPARAPLGARSSTVLRARNRARAGTKQRKIPEGASPPPADRMRSAFWPCALFCPRSGRVQSRLNPSHKEDIQEVWEPVVPAQAQFCSLYTLSPLLPRGWGSFCADSGHLSSCGTGLRSLTGFDMCVYVCVGDCVIVCQSPLVQH